MATIAAEPSESAAAPPKPGVRSAFRWEYAVIVAVILLVADIRFRLRDMPLERDEGEYAYFGQLLLQGIPPYKFAYSMKLPGTYAAYAAVMAVFGETPAGIHIGVLLVNAASIFLIFLITKKLFDSMAAVVAGATFGLFCLRPALLGLAGHATHFVTFAALASLFVLLNACGTERFRLFFWSGALSGIAFLMKQPGLFFAIFAVLYLCCREWPGKGLRGAFWKKLGLFAVGAVVPYTLTCLILLRAGVFARFWFWTVSYARAYGSELYAWRGFEHFANGMAFQEENVWVIWCLVVVGLSAFLWDRLLRTHAPFVLGLLGFSALALSAGLLFRPHYFIVIYPVLAILAGIAVSSTMRLRQRVASLRVAATVPLIVFLLAFANALYAERRIYFLESGDQATRDIYGDVPFPEAIGVGRFIKKNSNYDARVGILGSEPEILFYANRLSASGYLYTYPLMENQPYAPAMKAEYLKELEAAQPEFLVSMMINASWYGQGYLDHDLMSRIDAMINAHYSLVGIADGGNRDVFRWGPEAARYRPRRPTVILVYYRTR